MKRITFFHTATFTAMVTLLSLFTFTHCNQGKGEEIETIGSKTITTGDYEDYYTTYVEKAARFANAEKSTLFKLMCNPDQVPASQLIQDLIQKLQPENNYEEYRQMRIYEQAARAEGFHERPVIKKIIDQVVLETIVRLYMQEKMEEKVKITTEQKQEKCNELRRQYPQKVASLPLDTCLYIAEGILKQEIFIREDPRLREELKEGVVIKKNPKFDRDDYFKNKFSLYNTIRKEGGCAVETNQTPAHPETK